MAVWFSHVPLGVITINSLMKNMASAAGLDLINKWYTNHSIRKTTVQKLKKAGVSTTDMATRTNRVYQTIA